MKTITAIQTLTSQDVAEFQQLLSVFETVFEMENINRPDISHLQRLLANESFFSVVALSGNAVVGGLTGYILEQYHSVKPLAYIYDLAVLTAYQRKGIGKELMKYTHEYCRQKGYQAMFVQAEKIDDYAIDFYRLTNPTTEEQVVHFTYVLP